MNFFINTNKNTKTSYLKKDKELGEVWKKVKKMQDEQEKEINEKIKRAIKDLKI